MKSLDAIGTFVKDSIEKPIDKELVESKLRDFAQIRNTLSWVYGLSKEAIAADSLSIPFSLATYINKIAKEIQKNDGAALVMLGSSDLMYYKYNLKQLRKLTQNLADRIKGYPILTKDIGILMFPYSATKDVLINCDLFHELGHYIYETQDIEGGLCDYIAEKLADFVNKQKLVDKLVNPLMDTKRLLIHVGTLLLKWSEEIFADIFAIRTAGPAFHLAYRELQQMTPVPLDESSMDRSVSAIHKEAKKAFSETYPADNFRFKIHSKWLRIDGWDKVIEQQIPSIYKELLECDLLQMKDFNIDCKLPIEGIEEKDIYPWMLDEFNRIVEKIEAAVSEKISNQPKLLSDYIKNNKLVIECLEHGVVPSTVYDESGQKSHPTPETILNCGFFFYLQGMEELLKRVVDSGDNIQKRVKYEGKLNEWLGKAIEDWQILHSEGKL
jgi:hypothetical protein